MGLSVIRIIEEEALKDNTAQVRTILPAEIAAYILNEKRQAIIDIEKRQGVSIIVVPSAHLLTPQYEVERVRTSDLTEKDEKLASYKLAIKQEITAQSVTTPAQKPHQEPAIKNISMDEIPAPPAPQAAPMPPLKKGEPGLLKKLFTFLFEKKETPPPSSSTQEGFRKQGHMYSSRRRGSGGRHHHHRDHRGRRDRDRKGPSTGYRNYEHRDHKPREAREHHEHDTRDQRPREMREKQSQVVDQSPSSLLPIQNQAASHLPVIVEQTEKVIPSNEPNLKPSTETTTPGTNKPEQAPRNSGERRQKRFKPHRRKHRQYSSRQDVKPLEGEDIYSNSNKNNNEDES